MLRKQASDYLLKPIRVQIPPELLWRVGEATNALYRVAHDMRRADLDREYIDRLKEIYETLAVFIKDFSEAAAKEEGKDR